VFYQRLSQLELACTTGTYAQARLRHHQLARPAKAKNATARTTVEAV